MGKDTKDKLLHAAVTEFARHGFAAATVRGIVDRAGVKNLNAVVYYFGSKEGLYKAVLDFMFLEAGKFKRQGQDNAAARMDVENRLASFIRFLCRAYYCVDTPLDKDLYQIFVKEAGSPTPFFHGMVKRHLGPGRARLCALLREYLGPGPPERVIRDCEYSISAQILYGALGRAIIQGVEPDRAPFGEAFEELADHVVKFTLAGLGAFKDKGN